MRSHPALRPLALLLVCTACLENEETIEVHPDGALTVQIRASGDCVDLADGYPVPFGGPWQPVSDDARRWLEVVGATGGDAVAALDPGEWSDGAGEAPRAELVVRADFASVADLPEILAPATEPYRTAYTRRTAGLSIEQRGDRTVYVFERVYHRRPYPEQSFYDRFEAELSDELSAKLEALEDAAAFARLSDAEWRELADAVAAGFRSHASRYIRYSLEGLYTEGDASLDPRAVGTIVEHLLARGEEELGPDALRDMMARVAVLEGVEGPDGGGSAVADFERKLRDALRTTLASQLEEHGVAPRAINGVLRRVEWSYTSSDHEDDLLDESFRVIVRMPGTIVSGNFHELDSDGAARWEFDGADLVAGDAILRVVSVAP